MDAASSIVRGTQGGSAKIDRARCEARDCRGRGWGGARPSCGAAHRITQATRDSSATVRANLLLCGHAAVIKGLIYPELTINIFMHHQLSVLY